MTEFRQFERQYDTAFENLEKATRDLEHKHKQLKKCTDDSILSIKTEIGRHGQEFKNLVDKKRMKKLEDLQHEQKESAETQFIHLKADLDNGVGRIDKFAKMIITLQQEMRSRDDALKRIPPNAAKQLKDLYTKIESQNVRSG